MSDIKTILTTIEGAVTKLSAGATDKQQAAFKKLVGMLKTLDTRGDVLLNNVKNLKLINNIKVEIERLIIDDRYLKQVKDFVNSYNDIQQLNNDYFAKFVTGFHPRGAWALIKKGAVEATLVGLTETGVQAGVTEGMRKILLTNMSAGGSYTDMTEQLRGYMLTDKETPGALERYVKGYATTAINQYSAEYNKAIADDLQLYWYAYTGSLLTTSRQFCIECVEKQYIHVSEFDELLNGHINGKQIHLSKSTGLPHGLMKGTDKNNFPRRRGGWSCGHQLIAISDVIVPPTVKEAVYATSAYKSWAKLNKKAA